MEREVLTLRYPRTVRLVIPLVWAFLATGLLRGPIHAGTIAITCIAICLNIHLLAYRAEVDDTEVRIRYAPFVTRHTAIRDITHLVEERTLVLVTATSRVPLWGLSIAARETLFRILPRHFQVVSPKRKGDIAMVASLRRHLRWTIWIAIGFTVAVVLLIPFLNDNPLNKYWNTGGKYLVLVCMVLFVSLVYVGCTTLFDWSYLRSIYRIENDRRYRGS